MCVSMRIELTHTIHGYDHRCTAIRVRRSSGLAKGIPKHTLNACVHMHMSAHMLARMSTHTHLHACPHAGLLCIFTHGCTHVYTPTCMSAHVSTHMFRHMTHPYAHTHVHTNIHTHAHAHFCIHAHDTRSHTCLVFFVPMPHSFINKKPYNWHGSIPTSLTACPAHCYRHAITASNRRGKSSPTVHGTRPAHVYTHLHSNVGT